MVEAATANGAVVLRVRALPLPAAAAAALDASADLLLSCLQRHDGAVDDDAGQTSETLSPRPTSTASGAAGPSTANGQNAAAATPSSSADICASPASPAAASQSCPEPAAASSVPAAGSRAAAIGLSRAEEPAGAPPTDGTTAAAASSAAQDAGSGPGPGQEPRQAAATGAADEDARGGEPVGASLEVQGGKADPQSGSMRVAQGVVANGSARRTDSGSGEAGICDVPVTAAAGSDTPSGVVHPAGVHDPNPESRSSAALGALATLRARLAAAVTGQEADAEHTEGEGSASGLGSGSGSGWELLRRAWQLGPRRVGPNILLLPPLPGAPTVPESDSLLRRRLATGHHNKLACGQCVVTTHLKCLWSCAKQSFAQGLSLMCLPLFFTAPPVLVADVFPRYTRHLLS